MKMFKKYTNLILASALSIATISMYSMEVVSIKTAPVAETVELTEITSATPVVWYKNPKILQKLSIGACIAIFFYIVAHASNKEAAITESLNVEPVVEDSDVTKFLIPENIEVVTTTFFNNMTMSFKEFGKRAEVLAQEYLFAKNSVNADMIGADELAEQYTKAMERLVIQQYGSN